MDRVLTGEQSPMFFGSAMTNFGVELFLKRFLTIGQKPASRRTGVSIRTHYVHTVHMAIDIWDIARYDEYCVGCFTGTSY